MQALFLETTILANVDLFAITVGFRREFVDERSDLGGGN
jgi:hypothetical protein